MLVKKIYLFSSFIELVHFLRKNLKYSKSKCINVSDDFMNYIARESNYLNKKNNYFQDLLLYDKTSQKLTKA